MFSFKGEILASKSWLNRALIIQHFNPQVVFSTKSPADDVVALKKALSSIAKTNVFDLGLGGTSFRFFVFLISRYPGQWQVHAQARLLERPQAELVHVLTQLGVHSEFNEGGLNIQSNGWNLESPVSISAELSSQFISGLVLSSWNLPADLHIQLKKPVTSAAYLKMTLMLLQSCGLEMEMSEGPDDIELLIFAGQKAKAGTLPSELDVSSAFSLAAAALVNGQAEITNWNEESTQPDLAFLDILHRMEISYEIKNSNFFIRRHERWRGVDCNLKNSPDLFPVLAVLCALAEGESILSGAEQLKYKESDRIQKTAELLTLTGFKTEWILGGLKIFGGSSVLSKENPLVFDPAHDHRMAMAAGLLKLHGYNIRILTPDVVNKSYPDFWSDVGLQV